MLLEIRLVYESLMADGKACRPSPTGGFIGRTCCATTELLRKRKQTRPQVAVRRGQLTAMLSLSLADPPGQACQRASLTHGGMVRVLMSQAQPRGESGRRDGQPIISIWRADRSVSRCLSSFIYFSACNGGIRELIDTAQCPCMIHILFRFSCCSPQM